MKDLRKRLQVTVVGKPAAEGLDLLAEHLLDQLEEQPAPPLEIVEPAPCQPKSAVKS